MRWTRAALLTRALLADGEVVWSRRPDAGVKFAEGDSARRRRQTSPVAGESTKETVKTIARGMPGVSGVTVVTMLVCSFHFAYEAAGASSARHSLCPLFDEGVHARLGRIPRGEIVKLCPCVAGCLKYGWGPCLGARDDPPPARATLARC